MTRHMWWLLLVAALGCRLTAATPAANVIIITATALPVSATPATTAVAAVTTAPTGTNTLPPPSSTATATTAPTLTSTPTPTASPTYTPYCAEPPEAYGRVQVGGHELNERTLAMLETARELYDGPGDLLRVTQGSYRDSLDISFGTHAGGGAVDISIRDPRQEGVFLVDEADAMVQALRAAGFAAWHRRAGDLGPGSAHHLHAIAIGDRELSEAAQEQVRSYFEGMDGLVPPWGPNPDHHGGPIVCPWMN